MPLLPVFATPTAPPVTHLRLRLFRFHVSARLLVGLAASEPCLPAAAWGPDGHHTTGAIAERLIAGTPAAQQVKQLLGPISLRDATLWADCARGVDPQHGFAYRVAGRYPECAVFETPAGMAGMADFVRRNDTNCHRDGPGDAPCHAAYHYTDVAIQRSRYAFGTTGTRRDDVVAALTASIAVLQGRPSPPPFDIRGRREALLLLAHFVGDVHQPLHVGAVYLSPSGAVVDPDRVGALPGESTRGGNRIGLVEVLRPGEPAWNVHAAWDHVPPSLAESRVDAAWLRRAAAVPPTPGALADWPAAWATQTLGEARVALQGLRYEPTPSGDWSTRLSPRDEDAMWSIKSRQLTLAGARLAQVLEFIWP